MQEQTDISFADVPADHSALAQMGSEGDIKYTWDPKNPTEVESAREHFEKLKAQGYLIYKMKRWSKDEPVEVFNPKDKRLLFVAPEPLPDEEPDGEAVNEPDEEPGRYVAVPAMVGG